MQYLPWSHMWFLYIRLNAQYYYFFAYLMQKHEHLTTCGDDLRIDHMRCCHLFKSIMKILALKCISVVVHDG
jgi:hypothetical protein